MDLMNNILCLGINTKPSSEANPKTKHSMCSLLLTSRRISELYPETQAKLVYKKTSSTYNHNIRLSKVSCVDIE